MIGLARRHLVIGGLAAAVALLAWFAPEGDSALEARKAGDRTKEKSGAGRAPGPITAEAKPAPGDKTLKSRVRSAPEQVPNLFKALSWYMPPPPPPPEPPPPPPPPAAPPLPFAYLGQYIEGDTQLLILSRGNRVLTTAVGDVIADTYRVDRFAGGDIHFTYLPLGITQTLKAGTN